MLPPWRCGVGILGTFLSCGAYSRLLLQVRTRSGAVASGAARRVNLASASMFYMGMDLERHHKEEQAGALAKLKPMCLSSRRTDQ